MKSAITTARRMMKHQYLPFGTVNCRGLFGYMKLKRGKKITIQKRDEEEAMEEEATGYGSVGKRRDLHHFFYKHQLYKHNQAEIIYLCSLLLSKSQPFLLLMNNLMNEKDR